MLRNMLRLRLKATDMQIVADTLSRMAKEYKPDELVTVNDWQNPYKAKIEHISLSEWRPSPQAIWQWAIAHGFSVPIENEPFFIPDDILKTMREEGRKWTVEISYRPIDKPWVGTVGSMGSGIYLRPIAHTEYPLLLEIGPSLTGTDRQFIKSVIDECKMLWDAEPLPAQPDQATTKLAPSQGNRAVKRRDSAHYAHSPEERKKIVKEYRQARAEGRVSTKEAWAQTNYHITARTLLSYEKEFPRET
jgi:hypothetical protein